jgi:hypothetical protein
MVNSRPGLVAFTPRCSVRQGAVREQALESLPDAEMKICARAAPRSGKALQSARNSPAVL